MSRVRAFGVGDGSGGVMYGITGPFKTIPTSITHSYRASVPLHLAEAKLILTVREATFTATHVGVSLREGEFQYLSRDGYLRITNIGVVSGVDVYDPEDFAIPISYLEREDVVLTNIYPLPVPVEE